jgi:hypothetical protein
MGVSANITSLPQPAPIILPQTTDHSTVQVPFNITTSGSGKGQDTKFAPLTVVATAEDGFFLDAAITVLYENEEAFLFLADRRNIIIHLKLNIKLLKIDYFTTTCAKLNWDCGSFCKYHKFTTTRTNHMTSNYRPQY